VRAIFHPEKLEIGETSNIEGDKAHHFCNVLRIKAGEQILALSGAGTSSIIEVQNISKRLVQIKCLEQKSETRPRLKVDLAISKLKKDAMDSVLKACCEMGIVNIHILSSEYSQNYPLKESRIEKLLVSGVEQSNNPFMPKIFEGELLDFSFDEYSKVFLFSSEMGGKQVFRTEKDFKNVLIVIGPEGGFSDKELSSLEQIENIMRVKLDIPIMRAPTAFNCAFGYIHGLSCSID
jgi:16S rRNA (uracil1498-N3)-methyltransferase